MKLSRAVSRSASITQACRPRLAATGLSYLLHNGYRTTRQVSHATRQFTTDARPDTWRRVISHEDTIFALSSAQGKAGIAVIRISGSACQHVYSSLCSGKPLPKPRYAAVRTLTESVQNGDVNILDSAALVLYFPGPKTVTGEDVLEFHVHGGSATVKAVLGAISRCTAPFASVRYAEPGEFTRRAFLNDRLDLAQVESLSDTLAADTEQQRRAAVRGNSGALGKTYESWRQELFLARGEIEALIDFSEDQHFDESPRELLQNVTKLVTAILHSIHLHETASQRSELLRNGIRIALLGPPNAGKSSLMNQIVGREASIVSDEVGTTRDIIEASLDIRGYLCYFADTAGIRSSATQQRRPGADDTAVIGAIEEEGIRRAKKKASESDIIIAMSSIEPTEDNNYRVSYDIETLRLAAQAEQRLIVINKCDGLDDKARDRLIREFKELVLGSIQGLMAAEPLAISCKEANVSAAGLKDPGLVQTLIDHLVQSFSKLTSMPVEMQDLLGVTERQRQLLVQCREHLEDFMAEAVAASHGEESEPDIVLAAEHLRFAGDCLARITGRGESGDVEEVLGVIFEKFCVGK